MESKSITPFTHITPFTPTPFHPPTWFITQNMCSHLFDASNPNHMVISIDAPFTVYIKCVSHSYTCDPLMHIKCVSYGYPSWLHLCTVPCSFIIITSITSIHPSTLSSPPSSSYHPHHPHYHTIHTLIPSTSSTPSYLPHHPHHHTNHTIHTIITIIPSAPSYHPHHPGPPSPCISTSTVLNVPLVRPGLGISASVKYLHNGVVRCGVGYAWCVGGV